MINLENIWLNICDIKGEALSNLYQLEHFDMNDRRKILLIEDSEKLRTTLFQLLSGNYEVFTSNEALKGIEICKREMPHLILLDIMLGDSVDGFSFLKMVKADDSLSHIPVILISALSSENIILEGLGLGANDYLTKPFSLKALNLKVKIF